MGSSGGLQQSELLDMRLKEKMTLSQIARRLGVSRQRVQKVIGRTGRLPKAPAEPKQKAGRGSIKERFWKKVVAGDPNECWEWQGHINPVTHYGRIIVAGKSLYPHRVAYELEYGPIPAGLYICHRCDNPRCCNPSHLFAGTPSDKVKDAVQKGRWTGNRPKKK